MKTYLVEAYSDEIQYDNDSLIVALTPEVCYQLDKKGIKYAIIEDYYDFIEVSNQVEEYRKSVFRWIDNIDEFLLNNIKKLNIKLGTIYRFYLKAMILDPLYSRSYALQHLFKKIMPTEVTYIAPEPDEPHLSLRFEHYGRSLYSQVIPIICAKNNIPLTTVLLEPDGKKYKDIKSVSRNGNLITRLKRKLYKSATVRRIYFTYRCFKKLPYLKRAGQKKLNIFIVRVSHIGEDFIAEALVRGHHVYLLSGDSILKYSCFGTRKYLNLRSGSASLNDSDWENAANLLAGHDLIEWVNEKCQMDVSEIVLPRLRHFILMVCPKLVGYIKEFIEFYEKYGINLFFAPTVSYLEDYAALAAAKRCPQITTACLVHGDAIYDSRDWNITELQNYDIHISSNTETKEYFKQLAGEIHSTAKIYSSPNRLLNVKRIASLRENMGSNAIRKNRVIYLPTLMMWDTRRNEGSAYTDTWYYRFQKSLLEYFATREDFIFVWKGLPQSEEIYNPIPDFIRDNHFSNIEIATNPFVEHLLTAGRVIHDCPSTGVYESVIAGVPTMSLNHRSTINRPGAVAYFGNLLKLFTDTPEAIKHIDEFLNNDAELYKMTIDTGDSTIFDIIKESGEGENK